MIWNHFEADRAALGKEVPCTCTGRVNLPKAVLVAMNGGVDPDTGAVVGTPADPDSYADFDAFYAAVLKQIAAFASRAEALIIAHERAYPSLNPAPLFSATLADCVTPQPASTASRTGAAASSAAAFSPSTIA